jgi:hypothetical protein
VNAPVEEKLLVRIRKLMRKAEDSATTPEESASFAAKARELLIANHLSEESLANVSLDRDPMGRELVQVAERFNVAQWKIDLMFGIAQYNFCRAIHTQMSKGHYMHVLGKDSDREVVIFLYRQLAIKIELLAKKERDRAIARGEISWYKSGDRHPSKWEFSFCNGAAHTIVERLWQAHEQDMQAHNKTTALIVLADAAVEEYKRNEFGRLGSFRGLGSRSSNSAYQQGKRAGYGIDINKGVESGGTSTVRRIK